MQPDAALPFRLLVGPLLRAHYLGDWLEHPQIQVFTSLEGVSAYHREVMEAPWYTFPPHTPSLPLGKIYTWADLWAQLPPDWTPDLLIWWGFYFPLPVDFAHCPCPLVVIAADWHVHLPAILAALPHCEQFFGDRQLLQALPPGSPAAYWPSYGWEPALMSPPAPERDLALSFVGNMQPATYATRNHLLRRAVAVAGPENCWVGGQLYNHDYASLFARSRLVLNHSLRGEMNMRAYEAAASGALLFLEDSNLEVREILPDGCVLYNTENLETLLRYYLDHPEVATELAQRGQKLVQAHTYTAHFGDMLSCLAAQISELQKRYAQRRATPALCQTPQGKQIQHALSLHFPVTHQLACETAATATEFSQTHQRAWQATAQAHYAISWLTGPARQQALHAAIELLKPCFKEHLALQHNLAWLLLWHHQPGEAVKHAVEVVNQLCQPDTTVFLEPWADLLLPLGYSSQYVQNIRLRAQWAGHPNALARARHELLLWNSFWLGGQAFAQLGQWHQAQEWLETAVRWRPELPEPYPELARVCLQQRTWAKAETVMRQGLASGALYPPLQLGLIRLLGSQGRQSEADAERRIAQALSQGPDAKPMREALAHLAHRLKPV
ncbi:MAG: glycosyltransferase family protein [Candidatus Sericytochromatia bacterium]